MDQKENELLAQLVAEARTTNQLLALAFGDAIEKRLRTVTEVPSTRSVLSVLLDGEMTSDALVAAARSHGVARTTLYRQLAELERLGIVVRPRRGLVALSPATLPYLGNLRVAKDEARAGPAEAIIE